MTTTQKQWPLSDILIAIGLIALLASPGIGIVVVYLWPELLLPTSVVLGGCIIVFIWVSKQAKEASQ